MKRLAIAAAALMVACQPGGEWAVAGMPESDLQRLFDTACWVTDHGEGWREYTYCGMADPGVGYVWDRCSVDCPCTVTFIALGGHIAGEAWTCSVPPDAGGGSL